MAYPFSHRYSFPMFLMLAFINMLCPTFCLADAVSHKTVNKDWLTSSIIYMKWGMNHNVEMPYKIVLPSCIPKCKKNGIPQSISVQWWFLFWCIFCMVVLNGTVWVSEDCSFMYCCRERMLLFGKLWSLSSYKLWF